MRRIIGFVLVGLGVALVTLGVSLRVWAYPEVSRVTAEYPTAEDAKKQTDPSADTTRSTGSGVQVFVAQKGEPIGPRTLDVVSTRITRGVPNAARGDNVYWETTVQSSAPSLKEPNFNVTIEGVCFNRVTGAVSDGCAKVPYYTDTPPDQQPAQAPPPPDRTGQFFKFPFNTQRQAYQFWDGVLGRATPAEFVGTDTIKGLAVYKFVQTIPEQKVGERPGLPGALFKASETSVTADIVYSNTRTLWVEPETGVIIRGQEEQSRHFQANGNRVPLLVGAVGYDDATQTRNVNAQKSNAATLAQLRDVYPVVAIALGVVSLLAGLALIFFPTRGSGRRRREASTTQAMGTVDGAPVVVDVREQRQDADRPN